MPIFENNTTSEKPKHNIVEHLCPYIDYPIEKSRKKELLKALDKTMGEHTENGNLNFKKVIDEVYDSCFELNEITPVEYTYLVQVLSLYVYHVVVAGVPIDLEKLL